MKPWYERYAEYADVAVNPNNETVLDILLKLEENRMIYGTRVCPCVFVLNATKDDICPCRAMQEAVARGGVDCKCGLFVAKVSAASSQQALEDVLRPSQTSSTLVERLGSGK